MKIEVTQEDIDQGMVRSCRECPVARAIKKKVGMKTCLGVTPSWVSFYDIYDKTDKTFLVQLPEKATEFINKFDGNEIVEPFEFELNITEEVIEKLKHAETQL